MSEKAKRLLVEYVRACCEGNDIPDPIEWLNERRASPTARPARPTAYRVVEKKLLEMTALTDLTVGELNEHAE